MASSLKKNGPGCCGCVVTLTGCAAVVANLGPTLYWFTYVQTCAPPPAPSTVPVTFTFTYIPSFTFTWLYRGVPTVYTGPAYVSDCQIATTALCCEQACGSGCGPILTSYIFLCNQFPTLSTTPSFAIFVSSPSSDGCVSGPGCPGEGPSSPYAYQYGSQGNLGWANSKDSMGYWYVAYGGFYLTSNPTPTN